MFWAVVSGAFGPLARLRMGLATGAPARLVHGGGFGGCVRVSSPPSG
jgi:hypothetical protein